jgi:AraC family transcriptional regulator
MQTRFFGEVVRELVTGEARIVETRHRAGERLPWHTHVSPYIAVILGGHYREHLRGGRTRDCDASMAVVHPAGEAHADTFLDAPARLVSIEVAGGALRRFADAPLLIRGRAVRFFTRRLQRELLLRDEVSPVMVDALLAELFGRTSAKWLAEADRLLQERFRQRFSVRDLAAALRMHPAHVARAFRAYFAASVGERLRQLRVEEARRLLARSNQPIAQIALALQFADQSHFTRWFRRLTGTTPAAFRGRRRRT